MTFNDVLEAIRHCNAAFATNLSDRNPANFMKDVVRGRNASRNWPPEVAALHYTGVQTPGDGNVFEFIPYHSGQSEPFPDGYKPQPGTDTIKVQSVSIPLAAKSLGRSDEPWLIQTAVNLRIVETHFAVKSELEVEELIHLQMSVKLRRTEIDALFLASVKQNNSRIPVVITCEAKQASQRILDHQIINQAKAAFEETEVNVVVPIAIRAIKKVGFHVIEFTPIARRDASKLVVLEIASEAIYELVPSVRGI